MAARLCKVPQQINQNKSPAAFLLLHFKTYKFNSTLTTTITCMKIKCFCFNQGSFSICQCCANTLTHTLFLNTLVNSMKLCTSTRSRRENNGIINNVYVDDGVLCTSASKTLHRIEHGPSKIKPWQRTQVVGVNKHTPPQPGIKPLSN